MRPLISCHPTFANLRRAGTGMFGFTLSYGMISLALLATAARADVVISSAATENMSCSNGVCTPTAHKAVLNVGDLETLLASGNATVTTTGSGVQAKNLHVEAPLSWTSGGTLALDANLSVAIDKAISVTGAGGLSLTTNDGGSGGTLNFCRHGRVTFANLASALTIDGMSFTLVNTIQSLASAIVANPSGTYAFASDYDASKDGTYTTVPVPTAFTGTFEGLGNAISNLSIDDTNDMDVGLFAEIDAGGALRDIGVMHASIIAGQSCAAPLAGLDTSDITDIRTSGSVIADAGNSAVGGLVGCHKDGTITLSSAETKASGGDAGGLVGLTFGDAISLSFATGGVLANTGYAGGLVGNAASIITNCYATGRVRGPQSNQTFVGGLAALTDEDAVNTSYATGRVTGGSRGPDGTRGGFVGYTVDTTFTDDYWDTSTSGVRHKAAGNEKHVAGITGLTTEQLQSGLPNGFDPSIWGENANVNNGLPYLLANSPE